MASPVKVICAPLASNTLKRKIGRQQKKKKKYNKDNLSPGICH